jgi:predicted MFS family arabinose efflux permease
MKPGYTTTEFWVTLMTMVGSLLAPILGKFETTIGEKMQVVSTIAACVAAAAYTLARAWIKVNVSQTPPS